MRRSGDKKTGRNASDPPAAAASGVSRTPIVEPRLRGAVSRFAAMLAEKATKTLDLVAQPTEPLGQ